MSLESLVDEIIQDAMARGEFDNLPGAGKPLNHDAYFSLPEDQRLAYTALKNAGYAPEEVELLREIKTLKDKIARCEETAECQRLHKELDARALKFNLLQEQKQHARFKSRKAR